MKRIKYYLLAIITLGLCAATTVTNKYVLAPDYTVTINGTSNLHDWNETVQKVTGEGTVSWNADKTFDINVINIQMDVKSIKGNMGSIMNNKTYDALKADSYPQIIFTLNGHVKSIKADMPESTLYAKGNLTIAGVTRQINMQVKLSMQGQNKLIFQGSQSIKMSDYNVEPPKALFGALKTGNDIVISFKTGFVLSN